MSMKIISKRNIFLIKNVLFLFINWLTVLSQLAKFFTGKSFKSFILLCIFNLVFIA